MQQLSCPTLIRLEPKYFLNSNKTESICLGKIRNLGQPTCGPFHFSKVYKHFLEKVKYRLTSCCFAVLDLNFAKPASVNNVFCYINKI